LRQSDYICPLCCEELDISDREFYPCKCGYQVCVFCWHKIRNTENGLCPACRTAYGEDPHQFTALDVEEVLKAKKEAQVAAKRERHLQSQLQYQASHSSGASGSTIAATMAVANDTVGTTNADTGTDSIATVDVIPPKDRSQLANLRVIRRNLIYVVGLPPSIANEEMLRRPEYFGQYGKLAKVVFNRSQITPGDGGDPRRASSSAYITFQYKEDTLACILALDGFYIDNRTIRASYGTSKYCSAFIKHVRCSNPECTYLHEMGAAEDTFTKQEIQAGYVTSGRDVLARQQQILQEQLKLQTAGASAGQQPPRKRVGGGGPSGTGKASANPIFPAPEYDEPMKSPPVSLPSAVAILKASSIGNPLSSSTMQSSFMNAGNIPAKLGRASSIGIPGSNPVVGASNATRKPHAAAPGTAAVPTTAASVVASGRVVSKDASDGVNVHSTLTALTPLKRSSVKGAMVGAGSNAKLPPLVTGEKAPGMRNGKKQNGTARAIAPPIGKSLTAGSDTTTPTSLSTLEDLSDLQSSAIGGDVIGLPLRTTLGGSVIGSPACTQSFVGNLAELGGTPINISGVGVTTNRETENMTSSVVAGSSLLGGSLLVPSTTNVFSSSAMRNDIGSGVTSSSGVSGNSGVIGSHITNQYGNSSSALASILGINLPTGSGSLQQTSNLWPPSPTQQHLGPSPLSMLNESSMQDSPYYPQQGAIGMQLRTVGPPQLTTRSSQIGGVPIRSNSGTGVVDPGVIGGFGSISHVGGGGNQSDIALLQSLLPGVHITTDRSVNSLGSGAVPNGHGQEGSGVGGNEGIIGAGSWVGASEASNLKFTASSGRTALGGSSVGQNHTQQRTNKGSGIW
jgi:CCR4-NOT transcription complex subunit 4